MIQRETGGTAAGVWGPRLGTDIVHYFPSPPLGVQDRGSHGCSAEVAALAAENPGIAVVVVVVGLALVVGVFFAAVVVVVGMTGGLTANAVPVTTVTGEAMVGS